MIPVTCTVELFLTLKIVADKTVHFNISLNSPASLLFIVFLN